MEIKNINEMGWVRNGDPCTGIFSISDLVDTDYDETEYEYGINKPYYNLAKNDKILIDRLKDIAESFDPSSAAKRVISNRVYLFQFSPDLSKDPTNASFKLYNWKVCSGSDTRGIRSFDFSNHTLKKNSFDAAAPGLDSRTVPVNLLNHGIKIGDCISITVTIVMRPFACALDSEAKGKLTLSTSDTKVLASAPVNFSAKSTYTSNGYKIWRPVRNGCTYPRKTTVIHKITSTKDATLLFSYESFSGNANRYLAPAIIDVEIRQLNPLF